MVQTNFTGGEIDPEFWDNADLAQAAAGAGLLQNLLPSASRPAKKRPGFWDRGAAAATGSLLIPYRRSVSDSYMIELGALTARIWGANGLPIMNPAAPSNPLIIATSYAEADLAGLRYKQIGNFILFFHADGRAPKRLHKVSETSWEFADFVFEDGPWQNENVDEAKTITASDYRKNAGCSLTSNFDIFESGMVGTFIRVRNSTGLPGLRTWISGWDPGVESMLIISNGRIYRGVDTIGTHVTGTTPPSHDKGIVSDGSLNKWEYLHDNSGIIKITTVNGARSAVGVQVTNLPTAGNNDKAAPPNTAIAFTTFAWAFSAYSNFYGWPRAWPELREERLIVGGGKTAPDTYHASQTRGYDKDRAQFSPGMGSGLVVDDDAITGFVGDDGANGLWFCSGALLVMGTSEGEAVLVGDTGEQLLTPNTAKPRNLSNHGSSATIKPLKIQDAIVYVTRSEEGLRDLAVSAFDFPGQSQDLSFYARHLTQRGFAAIAYQGDPHFCLWGLMKDQSLTAMVYHREMNVRAWSRHSLGGGYKALSIASLPDPQGRERLWALVTRASDGVKRVWQQSTTNEKLYLDGARSVTGSGLTTLGGFIHENGQTLKVRTLVAQGKGYSETDVIIASGNAAAPVASIEIVAGHAYAARYESLSLIGASSSVKYGRPFKAKVRFYGVTIKAGQVGIEANGTGETIRAYDDLSGINPDWHRVDLSFGGAHETQPRFYIEDTSGYEFTLSGFDVEAT